MPREVVYGEGNQPFAQKTDLGWSVISYGDPGEYYGDAISLSHCITLRQVTPKVNPMLKLKSKVHYVCKNPIKEMTAPEDIIKILEADFNERAGEDCLTGRDQILH